MALVSDYIDVSAAERKRARRERVLTRINAAAVYLNILGLGWIAPIARIAAGDLVKPQLKELRQGLLVPLIGLSAFLLA